MGDDARPGPPVQDGPDGEYQTDPSRPHLCLSSPSADLTGPGAPKAPKIMNQDLALVWHRNDVITVVGGDYWVRFSLLT